MKRKSKIDNRTRQVIEIVKQSIAEEGVSWLRLSSIEKTRQVSDARCLFCHFVFCSTKLSDYDIADILRINQSNAHRARCRVDDLVATDPFFALKKARLSDKIRQKMASLE